MLSFVCTSLAAGRSPVQGALQIVIKIHTWNGVKFVKGEVNAGRQNSKSQHWEYESQKLDTILSQFDPPTILKTYFPYVQLTK